MSCNLNIVKNFRVSRTLFTKEDGSPILFYVASPSDALKEIVEKGGGVFATESELELNWDHCIKLCDSQNDPEIKQGYLPLSYIKHCVMRNKLISQQFYRDTQLGQRQGSPPSAEEEDSVHDDQKRGSKLMVCPQIMGRKKYTLAEDLNIMKYLINHDAFSHVGGNKIWKRMEALKITDHSFQSMKYRYHKNILPGIHQYDIPSTWITKLTKIYRKWTQEDEEVDDEMEEDDFEEPHWEDDETLEPEAVCDESSIHMAKEKSNASTSDLGSKVSERKEKAIPDHNIDRTTQKFYEINVDRSLNTNGISEENSSSESDSSMKFFSVKTKNPSVSCKAKDPKFTRISSLADSDDVDNWIVEEIDCKENNQSKSPLNSSSESESSLKLFSVKTMDPFVSCKAKDPKFTRISSLADNDDVDNWIVEEIDCKKISQSKSSSNSDDEVPADQILQASEHLCSNGGHYDSDYVASRDLTQLRIEAIARHYNVSQSEAAYLWLNYPDKFWPAV